MLMCDVSACGVAANIRWKRRAIFLAWNTELEVNHGSRQHAAKVTL
jgi:hypothetical protein